MATHPISLDLGDIRGPQGPQGQPGTNGTNGTNFRCGAGAPESSVGSDGDTYFDATGLGIYCKLAGSWMLVSSPFGAVTTDLADNDHWAALRNEVDLDTKTFLAFCNNPGQDYDGRIEVVRRGGVATFHFHRPPRDVATELVYAYTYGYVTVSGEQKDHKSFGAILPEGLRPAHEIYVPCKAWTGTDGSRTVYVGIAIVGSDGHVGITRLYAENSPGTVQPSTTSTTLTLTGLVFAATYVLP